MFALPIYPYAPMLKPYSPVKIAVASWNLVTGFSEVANEAPTFSPAKIAGEA
jgi:hypothetical protein